jgi:acetyl-CoA C-acetyltransferase
MIKPHFARPIYIVDGLRAPQLKARGKPGPFSASDLAVQTCRMLLAKQPFAPQDLDEVVAACMMPNENEANIARIIALRLGCGDAMPAYTVQRNCGSGLQSIDSAALDIASGRCDLVLAGGTEAMSHAPVLFNRKMVEWLAAWNMAKSFVAKAKMLAQFRPAYLAPIIALIRGLSDPLVGYSMGQTAELIAFRFGITREQMDTFAMQSHQRLATAQDNNLFTDEITPIYDNAGNAYTADDGVRRDTVLEKLATLKPMFDKPFGLVTAGNSSQITDGASFVLLASEQAVKKYNLPILARIVDVSWKALDPRVMGLGPVYSTAALLQQQHLTSNDIDYWEINEAFAGQVLGCLAAWQDETFCREQLGLKTAFGAIDPARLNIDGGAIAIGHPVGASAARITLHLANILKRKQAKRGVATMCIGGGQGGSVLLETE